MKDRITEINWELARQNIGDIERDNPPSIETIGKVVGLSELETNYLLGKDTRLRKGFEKMGEVDGAEVALLLMEAKKRYSL